MRDDLVVPGEHEEDFVLARDAKVVTVPFSPLELRMSKEKPYLMEGLAKLREKLGEDDFKRQIQKLIKASNEKQQRPGTKRTA